MNEVPAETSSALDAAFALSREIKEHPMTLALHTLLRDLRGDFDPSLARRTGRAPYGFAAESLGPRLSGYAMIAFTRAIGTGGPYASLPPLTNDEQELILRSYVSFVRVVRLAMEPLLVVAPQMWDVVDPDRPLVRLQRPASHLLADLQSMTTGPSNDEAAAPFRLWSAAAEERLVRALHAHPAHALIRELLEVPAARNLLYGSADAARLQVRDLRRALWRAGAHGIPDDWTIPMHMSETGSGARARFRAGAALLALRCSAWVLEQLLYQRLNDKKPIISDDIVVSVPSRGWSEIAIGATVQVIPLERGHRFGDIRGEFLAFVTARDALTATGGAMALAEVVVRSSIANEYGEIEQLDLRQVDSFLNPYPGLTLDPLHLEASEGSATNGQLPR